MIGTMTKNLMKILMKIGRRTFEKIYRNKLLIYYRKRKNLRKLKLQIKIIILIFQWNPKVIQLLQVLLIKFA